MPIAIALLIRSIIQLALTAAIYKTAEEFFKAALDVLPRLLSKAFGISEQASRDFIHDFMIDQALAFGITILALRKKMPTIVAEKLGFTTRGFTKFGFGATARTAIEGKIGGRIPLDLTKGTGYWKMLGKFMGLVTAVFMLTQSIEVFAYRPQFFVHILSVFGLEKPARAFLEPRPKPMFSAAEITDFTNALKAKYGAGYPDKGQQMTIRITEDWVMFLLEAGEEAVRAQLKDPTKTNVLKAVREEVLEGLAPGTFVLGAPAAAGVGAVRIPTIKVFTGIIAQGKLGENVSFTPREDDLIENSEEMRIAAENNIASFLTGVFGRLIYQIKTVSRVTLKDGTTRLAQEQKIITGYTAAGTPKYKTILNRFAICDIFVWTARNVKTKIDSIVLGPVNAATFIPDANELNDLGNRMSKDLPTSNIADVQTIVAAAPLEVIPAATEAEILATPGVALVVLAPAPLFNARNIRYTGGTSKAGGPMTQNFDYAGGHYSLTFPYDYERKEMDIEVENLLIQLGIVTDPNFTIFPLPGQASVIPSASGKFTAEPIIAASPVGIPASNNPNKCSAGSISLFFDVNKKIYPSVAERGKLYEAFGLGPAAWYTGTSDQNLKLLTEFKKRSGCTGF